MTNKTPSRSMEAIDEVTLNYAEIKAIVVDDPSIKEKMQLENDIMRLKIEQERHDIEKQKIKENIEKTYPKEIEKSTKRIENIKSDLELIKKSTESFSIVLNNQLFTDKILAGQKLWEIVNDLNGKNGTIIGQYKNLDIEINFNITNRRPEFTLKGKTLYYGKELTEKLDGNLTKIDNVIKSIPELLKLSERRLEDNQNKLKLAKEEINKPFMYQDEIKEKTYKLEKINRNLQTLNE